jgi:hypothetical protein
VNDIVKQLRSKGFDSWFDKLTFFHILIIWASIITFFGLLYFMFRNNYVFLYNTMRNQPAKSILDYIYFSFVTATTTGFGDLVPLGYFKVIAIFEVIFGLLLLAFVTSKLVSIKQDMILSEIYEISFNERINRLRSSLLVFRQNLGRLTEKIEDKSVHKREVNDIYVYLSSFEDTLHEIFALVGDPGKNRFKKVLDPLNTEVVYNSVIQSFEKIIEVINALNQHKLEWRREITVDLIHKCIAINEVLFDRLRSSKTLTEKMIMDLKDKKNHLIEVIKKELPEPSPEPKPELIKQEPKT